ncbi:PA0069 family radical SAM protein [Chitinasiproducens palmae]|uniref:DNA repair photolyase n=1 Tax=Chitinasiproducens palmae TaxID=1770053 RepID=A0A1H2PUL1_9BURK|nr:PA0069 family radical SAM protein [Chitinasiproducens palmae]SDV50895.1 DNA repair photolyase [Chitinasiproducens palmae]
MPTSNSRSPDAPYEPYEPYAPRPATRASGRVAPSTADAVTAAASRRVGRATVSQKNGAATPRASLRSGSDASDASDPSGACIAFDGFSPPDRAGAPSYAPATARKGRGAVSNVASRFDACQREVDDGRLDADTAQEHVVRFVTSVTAETARTVISRNTSPDIPFDRSINPYRGCEHGCIYCYARPSHAYLGLSPGLDFETRLYAKTNAAAALRAELARPGYEPACIALGANTDPYQPIEREHRLTRAVLEQLDRCGHPVTITTKSALVLRDLDILSRLAQRQLVRVYLSVATLDATVARHLEPRATTPVRRIEAVRRLSEAGVPTGVVVAPVIPSLTDADIERVLEAAAAAGATQAGYVMLRLPREVRDLFVEWLDAHFPMRSRHVMSLIEQVRDGAHNSAEFGTRLRGTGVHAELVAKRFSVAVRRLGLNAKRPDLRTDLFVRPAGETAQMRLF